MTAIAQPRPLIRRRQRGWARLRDHRTWRRASLLATSLLVAWTAGVHAVAGFGSASAEALCPFGGLESLYRYVTSGGRFVPHVHASNLVLFGVVVLLAVALRSAFCGWLCPLGFLQEAISAASRAIQRRVPLARTMVDALRARAPWLAAEDRPMRFLKYAVLVWAVAGAAAFGEMIFRDWDPWAALLEIGAWSLTPGLVVLGVVLVGSLFVERPWCRHACPLGAVSGLASLVSPMRLQREPGLCSACGVCDRACPMGLPVATSATITSPGCIGCLECVGACPRVGALEVRLGVPIMGARRASASVEGGRWG